MLSINCGYIAIFANLFHRLIQEDKRCPGGQISVPRQEGQASTVSGPLEDSNTSTSVATSNQILEVRATELHASDLVKTGVDVVDDGKIAAEVYGEDGDRVSAGVLDAGVAVGDVDVAGGEGVVGDGEEDLGCGEFGACGWVGGSDGEVGDERRGAVWCGGELLGSYGAAEFVEGVEETVWRRNVSI